MVVCEVLFTRQRESLYYVPMPIDMLHKRHIKKMKRDHNRIRSIYQGKGDKVLKGGEPIELD